MFDGVVKGVVAPYFGIDTNDEDDSEEKEEAEKEKKEAEKKWDGTWKVGDKRFGWGCFGKGEVRGGW